MEINKRQKWMLILLGVVIAYAIFDFVTHKDEYLSYYTGKKPKTEAMQTVQKADSVQSEKPAKPVYIETWGRDPFADLTRPVVRPKVVKPKVVVPDFKLDAISYNGSNSLALINNSIYKNGDVIQGYRILQISPLQVILSNGENRIILKLENL